MLWMISNKHTCHPSDVRSSRNWRHVSSSIQVYFNNGFSFFLCPKTYLDVNLVLKPWNFSATNDKHFCLSVGTFGISNVSCKYRKCHQQYLSYYQQNQSIMLITLILFTNKSCHIISRSALVTWSKDGVRIDILSRANIPK